MKGQINIIQSLLRRGIASALLVAAFICGDAAADAEPGSSGPVETGFHCPGNVHPVVGASCTGNNAILLDRGTTRVGTCGECESISTLTGAGGYTGATFVGANARGGVFTFHGQSYFNADIDPGLLRNNPEFCAEWFRGEYNSNTRTCSCPRGHFPSGNHGICQECGASGQTFNPRTNSCEACPPGTRLGSGNQCYCASGFVDRDPGPGADCICPSATHSLKSANEVDTTVSPGDPFPQCWINRNPSDCADDRYLNSRTNQCQLCDPGSVPNAAQTSCEEFCPSPKVEVLPGIVCVCPDTHFETADGSCVARITSCPAGQELNARTNQCVDSESFNENLSCLNTEFLNRARGECVACPPNQIANSEGTACECPETHVDRWNGACEEKRNPEECPDTQFLHPQINRCRDCPPHQTPTDDQTGCECPEGEEYVESAQSCYPMCPGEEVRVEGAPGFCRCPEGFRRVEVEDRNGVRRAVIGECEEAAEGSALSRTPNEVESTNRQGPGDPSASLGAQISGWSYVNSSSVHVPPTETPDSSRPAALASIPAVFLIAAYGFGGGSEYLDPSYDLAYHGENKDFHYKGNAGFNLAHGNLRSYVHAAQANDEFAYESGVSYETSYWRVGYDSIETKDEYLYDLGAQINAEWGLWTFSPTADAEFHYRDEEAGWTSDASAGLSAAWTAHRWKLRARTSNIQPFSLQIRRDL